LRYAPRPVTLRACTPQTVVRVLTTLLSLPWFDLVGLASGLLCVWLLIRENIWTFPIGLVYAFVSLVIFYRARLYADLTEHVYYVVMNAYGWYYWLRGGAPDGRHQAPVTRIGAPLALALVVAAMAATAAFGWYLDTQTDAEVPYWDTATTVMSFIAMWMTARKYLENWYVWFVVDVVKTAIYVVKGIELYAVLYGVYLAMAVMGWWAWRESLTRSQPA
jgi:nicotinamide mononucleotide transporter